MARAVPFQTLWLYGSSGLLLRRYIPDDLIDPPCDRRGVRFDLIPLAVLYRALSFAMRSGVT